MPVIEHEAPTRLLICLGPCHGEFYYPLAAGEVAACPIDGTHPVAVYTRPKMYPGVVADAS